MAHRLATELQRFAQVVTESLQAQTEINRSTILLHAQLIREHITELEISNRSGNIDVAKEARIRRMLGLVQNMCMQHSLLTGEPDCFASLQLPLSNAQDIFLVPPLRP